MTNTFANHGLPVYACPSLACLHVTVDPVKDGYGDSSCPVCNTLLRETSVTRDPLYVTVAVYEMTRAYGGPEEGGWYYDQGTLLRGTQRSFLPEDEPQMEVYFQAMLHRYKRDPRYGWDQPRYSVHFASEEDALPCIPRVRPQYC